MKRKFLALILLAITSTALAQQVKIMNLDHPEVSFRGLSVVDNSVLWVSGTKGTIGVSYNGGNSFNWVNPKGYEERDFRAIAALNHSTLLAVAIGSPGIILKTTDSGKSWKEVYRDENPNVFLDDINFTEYNPALGMVVGDPINGEAYALKTVDSGDSWTKMETTQLSNFEKGEAFFAASNSNLKLLDETTFIAVTGGNQSHILYNSVPPVKVPLKKTNSTTSGANGMDYYTLGNFGLIVGGDFQQPDSSENNLFIFEIKEMKNPVVTLPEVPPLGYKSGVVIQNATTAYSCGLKGVDITTDKGKTWKNLTQTAYHSCKKAKNGKTIYLTGPQGRIGYILE